MIKIDVRIPFEPGGKLGQDYNRIMNETSHDWVLFVDHDVLLATNLHWYYICQQAIQNYSDAALFICYTNNIGCKYQKHKEAPKTSNLNKHRIFAKSLFLKNQYNCKKIEVFAQTGKKKYLSGFFLLLSKMAWEMIGGFVGAGMYKEDNYLHKRLDEYRLPIYLIEGLYCYHLRDRSGDSWIKEDYINTDYLKIESK